MADAPSALDIHFHPKQYSAFTSEATELLFGGSAGPGKALAVDTPIPTPKGWTAIGVLKAGDEVFDEHGKPTLVLAVTDVLHGRPCFEVEFSDGEKIVADANHLWHTFTAAERVASVRRLDEWRAERRQLRPSRGKGLKPWLAQRNAANPTPCLAPPAGGLRTTAEIYETQRVGVRANHSLPEMQPLELPKANFAIDPYTLGAWLGDGTSSQGAITGAEEDVAHIGKEIAGGGFEVRRRASRYGYGVLGLQGLLRGVGLLNNKHIPQAYLRGSFSQRLALLQGLMDTDGSCDARGGDCELTTTLPALRDGVQELLASLGIVAKLGTAAAILDGRVIGPKWRLNFTTALPVFRLPRKAAIQKRSGFRATHGIRYIVAVKSVPSVPVRCVQVAAASGLFLAGRKMIPTHNSHLMRIAAIMWCSEIPGLQVYIFRRVEDDLLRNHMEGPKGFRNLLGTWVMQGWCTIIETEIRFWNGSKIYLCHCKDEAHRFKYHGAEIHLLMPDELTTFTEIIYRYLRFRVRMVGIKLPDKYRKGCVGPNGQLNEHDLFPRILAASNPGNIGHHWVKRTFGLDSATGIAEPTKMPDIEGGMVRQYIGGLVSDNPSMVEDDPGYVARMRGLGDPALVRAMESGDWNIIAGGFFPEFSLARHVLKAVALPAELFTRRFIGVDWGSARPFSVGWYGIADDPWKAEGVLGNEIIVPRGALVRYREWYGAKQGEDNKGIKLPVDKWAAGVLQRTGQEQMRYAVVDPSMFSEDGGPSLAERAMKVKLNGKGLVMRPADNKRVGPLGHMVGWDQVRARLVGNDDGQPLLFLMDNQPDAIRTIQAVQHDESRVEDLQTESEDHAVDECRYACASRPLPAMKQGDRKIRKGPAPFTFDWLLQQGGEKTQHSTYRIE